MNNPEVVTKSGEEWLRLSMVPDKRGMRIDVRAHPLVEEFMQSLGGGKKIELTEMPRHLWTGVDDINSLGVYRMDTALRNDGISMRTFRIDTPGYGIIDEDDIVNLSFLRFVGVSAPEGISFISTRDVYPVSYRRQLRTKIGNAFRDFCRDYIKQVKITLIMTGQEI